MKSLRQQLLEGVQASAGVSQDPFLLLRLPYLNEVMDFVEQTPSAAYARAMLTRLFATQNWALAPQLREKFFQLAGELQFWVMSEHSGVPLERIPEDSEKSPDFKEMSSRVDAVRFEVKTLSVAGGWRSLDAIQESGFEANLDISSQLKNGAKVAMTVQHVASHGAVLRGSLRTTMCRNLIQKASNNIKVGQYVDGPTFLVLNLMLIDGHESGNAYLRPVASGFPRSTDLQTGVLWTIAFGDVGQLVHTAPEFDGGVAIEGPLGRQGILVHPDYSRIEGLILVIHRMSSPPRLYGLWRSSNYHAWQESMHHVAATARKLTGDNWNDENDSNGWTLTEHH